MCSVQKHCRLLLLCFSHGCTLNADAFLNLWTICFTCKTQQKSATKNHGLSRVPAVAMAYDNPPHLLQVIGAEGLTKQLYSSKRGGDFGLTNVPIEQLLHAFIYKKRKVQSALMYR